MALIDYNSLSDKQIKKIYDILSDTSGSSNYDYSEDLVFKCLKNPSEKIKKDAIINFPINEKYCKTIKKSLAFECSKLNTNKLIVKYLSENQITKLCKYNACIIEYVDISEKIADDILTNSSSKEYIKRFIIKKFPHKIDEYLKDEWVYLDYNQITYDILDKYIEKYPTQLMTVVNSSLLTQNIIDRAIKANIECYQYIPIKFNTIDIQNFVKNKNIYEYLKRNCTQYPTIRNVFDIELLDESLTNNPLETVSWIFTYIRNINAVLTTDLINKLKDTIEDNNIYSNNLLTIHSPEYIDRYLKNNWVVYGSIFEKQYTLSDDQICFIMDNVLKHDKDNLRQHIINLKRYIYDFSPDLVLKYPDMIFGCSKLDDELFEQIVDGITLELAANVVYNRTEQDHIKLFLKLRFG